MSPLRRFAVVAGSIFLMAGGNAQAQMFNPETFTLKNGLQVVVIPNHRVPVVSHMLWYKVGSGDEQPGKTGLAHMVEHMMFKGTKTVPAGAFSKIVAQNGGRDNAFTTADYTAFYQNVSVDKLDLVMKLEADRMANLKLDDKDFQPERQVVLEERRMRIENEPEALLQEQMTASLFLVSPYHHPVIGWRPEIEGYKLADIVDFHKRWYAPNNAVLILSGDVTAAQVRPLAEKYYGVIPARPVPPRVREAEPEQVAGRSLELRDPDVHQPDWIRSYLAPSYHQGDTAQAYPLQLLAEIVGGGNTSRLYKALVVERKLAASADAGYNAQAVGLSSFDVEVTPAPGVSMEQLIPAVEDELKALADSGVTEEEVARAKQRLKVSVSYAKDSFHTGPRVLGAALTTGETAADVEAWPQRIAAVTAEQVSAAAKAVLQERQSVTGQLLPARPGDPAPSEEARAQRSLGAFGREMR
ncbi:MAG TPA: pitrilysin family protein [Candidatus Sulfotelmatobacter sp.]|jgi:zinc protease|nr:pitrilysin family protein [Candidatus Sulfotelmatobacter sp.]